MVASKILFIFLSLLLVALITFGVFVLGVYEFDWDGRATKVFVKFVPLPVAVVNGQVVSFADYWAAQEASMRLNSSSQKSMLEKLIKDKVVENLLAARQQTATEKESAEYYEYLLNRFGLSEDQAAKELYERFGVGEETFRKLVVVPDLNENKLKITWNSAQTGSNGYQMAMFVKEQLAAGINFDELAKSFSDDEETRYIGGDLGFLTLQEMPPWQADAVSSLRAGERSEIVVCPDGYRIFKVLSQSKDSEPKIHLRQIFLKNDGFDEFLQKQIEGSRILIFNKL